MDSQEGMKIAWKEAWFLGTRDKAVLRQLFNYALVHFKNALITGDDAAITAAWSEVAEAAAYIPQKGPRISAALNLLRNPTVSKSAFAVRHLARPAMRWALSA